MTTRSSMRVKARVRLGEKGVFRNDDASMFPFGVRLAARVAYQQCRRILTEVDFAAVKNLDIAPTCCRA